MKQGQLETITTRIVSTAFVVVALAVFKPFGLDAWQWQAYVHLVALGVIGFTICMMTDIILKYVVKMPRSFKKGVEYIIHRNLWFQFVNTPLVALGICLYRHFVLTNRVAGNQLSIVNFLETLVIIAFCSFAIGLYWRFKFRSKSSRLSGAHGEISPLTPFLRPFGSKRPKVERAPRGGHYSPFCQQNYRSPLGGSRGG